MTQAYEIDSFLHTPGVILDVRSPAEYTQGHIPGSISLPLFTDSERHTVGTTYKQIGKQQAIDLGLAIVGPKLANFVAQAREFTHGCCAKVHCWRGGMRSASMAWLLETAGMEAIILTGGYKAFRNWSLAQLQHQRKLIVLGGLTGSGKTEILHSLKNLGEQVLDLEELANHRGSSYGMLLMPPQPSNEHFENRVAFQLSQYDFMRPIWVEDESRMIGRCKIPDPIFNAMQKSSFFCVERPIDERLEILMGVYGKADPSALIESTLRLTNRLGAVRTKEVIDCIETGKLSEAVEIVLKYYDKTYRYSCEKQNKPMHLITGNNLSAKEWAEKLMLGAHDKEKYDVA